MLRKTTCKAKRFNFTLVVVTISCVIVSLAVLSNIFQICNRHGASEEYTGVELITTFHKEILEHHRITIGHLCRSQKSRIHVLCINCNNSKNEWYELLKGGCRKKVKLIFPNETQTIQEFHHLYIHSSVNSIEYELFCFIRHIYIYEYLDSIRARSIIMHDADMLFFKELPEILPKGFALTKYSTFLLHWQRHQLELFIEFMRNIYTQDIDMLVEFLNQYGDPKFNVPVGNSGRFSKHFSDMYMLTAFMEQNVSQFRLICDPNCPTSVTGLINARTLLPCDSLRSDLNLTWSYRHDYGMNVPVLNGIDILGLHLQGNCKELLNKLPL